MTLPKRFIPDTGLVPTLAFWAAAVLLLFWSLGNRALWGSEDRWAEIARNMLLTGDYAHPIINGEVYFVKPLLSYWFITAVTPFTGGLNELAARVPSAIAGLAALWGTVYLGRLLWSKEVARLSGWLMLTCLGFIFWSRTAAADMANVAAIVLAVAWFFAREKTPGFLSYFVFYLICVLGAHTKSLAAIAVPLIAVFPYVIRENRWKTHLRLSHLFGALLAAIAYLLPFVIAAEAKLPPGYSYPNDHLSGLEMVYQENVTRFFEPFDHKGPVYLYLYELPRILLPWAPFFLAALYAACRGYKHLDRRSRWLLEALVLIFLFFSASGSRRWYYILPIVPFCALLTAVFLCEPGHERLKRFAAGFTAALLGLTAVLFVLSPALWSWGLQYGFRPPDALRYGTLLIGIAAVAAWALHRLRPALLPRFLGIAPGVAPLVAVSLVLMGGILDVQRESLEPLRTNKAFARALKEAAKAPENLAFFGEAPADLLFYLDVARPVKVLRSADELRALIENPGGGTILVSYRKFLPHMAPAVSEAVLGAPLVNEEIHPWEEKDTGRKLAAWTIERSPSQGSQERRARGCGGGE